MKKSINIICLIWWAIALSTIQHPIIFGFFMSKTLGGNIFVIFLAIIVIIGILAHQIGAVVAAIFVFLIYMGVVWTQLPISKVISNPSWQWIPLFLLFAVNVMDLGKRVKVKK